MDNTENKGITKEILTFLAVGGIIAATVIAPGLGILIKEIEKEKLRKFDPKRLKSTIKRLEKQKLVSWREDEDGLQLQLTENGVTKISQFKLDEMKIKKPWRWDRCWRMVIFDIPEKNRLSRDLFRKKLVELGFSRIQKSIFIHPYECEEEVKFLAELWGIGQYVNFLVAKSIDREEMFKKYFGL